MTEYEGLKTEQMRQFYLARDLHDRSIQTISDVGASLQMMARRTQDPALRHRLIDDMCALDTAVLAIQSVFPSIIGSGAEDRFGPVSKAPAGQTGAAAMQSLTQRERAVLTLITEGRTNRQIGVELGLAEKTVKNYVSGILAKLGMQRRTQAAVFGALLSEPAGAARTLGQ